jgi:hypothetical protein
LLASAVQEGDAEVFDVVGRAGLWTGWQNATQMQAEKGDRSKSAAVDFASVLHGARRVAPNRSRSGDRNSPAQAGEAASTAAAPSTPKVGDVVISPFNPLGLPISGTLAPTAAEVAADPERWKGTSFDPARTLGQTVIQPYVET